MIVIVEGSLPQCVDLIGDVHRAFLGPQFVHIFYSYLETRHTERTV